jgi:hypothetical protein
MATNTTKLGLIKPDLTDIVDIGDLNDNADDIDAAVGAAIVTSTTRPSAPWTGQIIHETDTDKTLVWDGVAWVETGTAVEDLDDLGDVDITSVSDGQVLSYSTAVPGWVNQFISGAQLPAGSILQVANTTLTGTFSTASTTYTALTGLSVSITPTSATSKILVNATIHAGNGSSDQLVQFRLLRASTVIAVGDGGTEPSSMTTSIRTNGTLHPASVMHLDSPNTTSATTYSLQMRVGGGTGYVNRRGFDANFRPVSTITVWEVVA